MKEWKLNKWWQKTIYITGWIFTAMITLGILRGLIK